MLISELAVDHYPPSSAGLFEAIPHNVIVLPVLFEDRVERPSSNSPASTPSLHRTFAFSSSSPPPSESCSTVSKEIPCRQRRPCSSSPSSSPSDSRPSRKNCSRPTSSSLPRKPSSSPSRTPKSNARIRRIEQARGASRRRRPRNLALRLGEVQIRIPRHHVARASHTAQRHPWTRPAARRKPRQQPQRASKSNSPFIHGAGTGGILNLTISDILDLSQVESGTSRSSKPKKSSSAASSRWSPGHSATRPTTANSPSKSKPTPTSPAASSPTPNAFNRSSKTSFPTPSNSREQGGVRLSVSSVTGGWTPTPSDPRQRGHRSSHSKSPTPASASPRKNSASSSRPSSGPTRGTSRWHGGTGLGLAISRRLAGHSAEKSNSAAPPAKGSTFTLFLFRCKPMCGPHPHLQSRTVSAEHHQRPTLTALPISSLVANEPDIVPIEDDRYNNLQEERRHPPHHRGRRALRPHPCCDLLPRQRLQGPRRPARCRWRHPRARVPPPPQSPST